MLNVQKSVKLGIFITFYLKRGWNEILCWQLCRLAFYLRTLKGNECIGGVCRWGILKNFYVTCSCTWTALAPLGRTHCGPWRDLRLFSERTFYPVAPQYHEAPAEWYFSLGAPDHGIWPQYDGICKRLPEVPVEGYLVWYSHNLHSEVGTILLIHR